MVTGGVPETTRLLENKFDYIFFTGMSHGTEQSPAWILCEEEDILHVFPSDIPAKKAGIGLGMWCQDLLEGVGCVSEVWQDSVPHPRAV